MPKEHLEPLLSEGLLSVKIRDLALRIHRQYREEGVKEVVLVGLLTGAFIFVAHLGEALQAINDKVPPEKSIDFLVDFLDVGSYEGDNQSMEMISSGEVKIFRDLKIHVAGRHVLICDDIADTLRTLEKIIAHIRLKDPKSVKVACMLQKEDCARVEVPIDFIGAVVPPVYVVGSGLDSHDRLRFLPGIWQVVQD